MTEYRDEDGRLIDPDELDDYEVVHDEQPVRYVDEHGNPVSAVELHGYEVAGADEAPTTPTAHDIAASDRKPLSGKAVGAGIVAALVVGAGALWGVSQWQAPTPIADRVAAKKSAIESSYRAESSAVRSSAEAKRVQLEPVNACGGYGGGTTGAAKAMWGGDVRSDTGHPDMRLKITSITDLPSGFVSRAKALDSTSAAPTTWAEAGSEEADSGPRAAILQLAPSELGVYVGQGGPTNEGGSWWKAVATTDPLRVTGEGPGTGEDKAMRTACGRDFQAGEYFVVGDGVPTDAKKSTDHVRLSAVTAARTGSTVWAIVGTSRLAQMELERDPAVGSTSPSPAPTTPNEK